MKYILFKNTNNTNTILGSDDRKEEEASRVRRECERVLDGMSEDFPAEVTFEHNTTE